jgi:CelD/BcsL family acetyltransferase involved in cellulose biosynthesis
VVASLLRFPELSGSQLGRWRELADRAAEPNPFFEPGFVLPAVRHLGERDLALAVVARDDRWLAAAPVRTRLRRIWVHTYCFLGTPLIDRDAVAEGLGGLLSALRPRSRPVAVLDTIALGGPIGAALARYADDVVVERRWERPAVDLRAGAEWPGPSSKARSDLRRRRRRLSEAADGEVETRDVTGDPGTIDTFLALEAAGWKGEGGTALGSNPAHVAFFKEIYAAFAGARRLEMLALASDDRTIAMTCNFMAGDAAFGFKTAYDEAYQRNGPGGLLIADMVERFANAGGPRLLDSCASSSGTHLDKVMPDRRELATMVLGRGLVGKAAGAGLRTALALRERRAS